MMPASDPELTSIEGVFTMEDGKGSLADVPTSAPPTITSALSPPFSTTTTKFADEALIENRAVSMASNDCSSALSSPAEASPAKPAGISPRTYEGTARTNTATSQTAVALESSKRTRTNLVNMSALPATMTAAFNTFDGADKDVDITRTITLKGITVTLEGNTVWEQFFQLGTEMIVTKKGRRMFPHCRYRIAGLEPDRRYLLVLSIVPFDKHKYRWNKTRWEVFGDSENSTRGQVRAFSHHHTSRKGSEWMNGVMSFYKLKLSNCEEQDDHICLRSMHRYIPRLHIIPVPDGDPTAPEQPLVIDSDGITFTFSQTRFMAVTTYQNFQVTKLKINYNPFARAYREDGRQNKVNRDAKHLVKMDLLSTLSDQGGSKDESVDHGAENGNVAAPAPDVPAANVVLKPIMSSPSSKDEAFLLRVGGTIAPSEIVIVEKRSLRELSNVSVSPKSVQDQKTTSVTPTPSKSFLGSSSGNRKRKMILHTQRGNSKGTGGTASSTVGCTSSLTAAELDDVEGQLFVSFTSKEALQDHRGKKTAGSSASVPPVSPLSQEPKMETVELIPETDEERITRMEALLLRDLRVFKRRQVIHPVLQKVGLKLSSLSANISIDLQYLGVDLPLPPTIAQEHVYSISLSLGDKDSAFISRTGKTSDVTRIKGWKNKFSRNGETSADCDGLRKNRSAFCSDMLDQYLESEAQKISERAEAFSAKPQDSVAYQLPLKSSSYVKTLDSVLKRRSSASNGPSPISDKSLTSQAPLSTTSARFTPVKAQSSSLHTLPGESVTGDDSDASGFGHVTAATKSSCTHLPCTPTMSSGQTYVMELKSAGANKAQIDLSKMETDTQNQGLHRTKLTTERVNVALSAVITRGIQYRRAERTSPDTNCKEEGPKCGQEFCRLGCVCASLLQQNRTPIPLHCHRPECMLGCDCLKRTISMQLSAGPLEKQSQTYFMANMQRPQRSTRSKKMWIKDIHDVDSEPLSAPKSWQEATKPAVVPTPQQPVLEEEKDPVYKYLESMMTCARVRAINSKPPSQITIEDVIPKIAAAKAATTQQKTTTELPKQDKTGTTPINAAKMTGQEKSILEKEAKKQLQIQSTCRWAKDQKMILQTLCQRMSQNKLSESFSIGPYKIRPLSKIFMQNSSGVTVTYRVQISELTTIGNDVKEEQFEDSVEEKLNVDEDSKEKDSPTKESEKQIDVTPFLAGVLPAGVLRARIKSGALKANELVQVNGKCYGHARLLLGNIGSLHPANRLAAYVTNRLRTPASLSKKVSGKLESTQKQKKNSALRMKVAQKVVPPVVTARTTTDLNIGARPPAQPDSGIPIALLQQSQDPSSIQSVQKFVTNQSSPVNPLHRSLKSHVFLSVSPSLKTPSFLGQSGTCSFRICPPTTESNAGQNLPGVALPGGFTLLQLPKPVSCEVSQDSQTLNPINTSAVAKSQPPKETLKLNSPASGLVSNQLGLNTHLGDENIPSSGSVKPGSQEVVSPDEPDDVTRGQMDLDWDFSSDSETSDSSDYSDEDEEFVDIETVETENKTAVAQIEDFSRSAHFFGNAQEKGRYKDQLMQHTLVERERRREQQDRFSKLHSLLNCRHKASRFLLLTQAQREINNLVQTQRFLEAKKQKLAYENSVYMKRLSHLSGKSEDNLKRKLNQICEKQKLREQSMKLTPFFSKLLQSRAALLQDTTPEMELKDTTQLESNLFKPACEATSCAEAQQGFQQIMTLLQSNLKGSKPIVIPHNYVSTLLDSGQAVSSLSTSVWGTNQAPQTNINSHTHPSFSTQPISVPLVRTKTGRIILPSFLKPDSQSFLKLKLLQCINSTDTKDADEKSSSTNTQPSAVDSQNQESASASESSPIPETDKSASLNSAPNNQAVCFSVKPVLTVKANPEGRTANGLNNDLKLNLVGYLAVDAGNNRKSKLPTKVSERENLPAAGTAGAGSDTSDNPVPVKRGRGRPPKPKDPLTTPPTKRHISSQYDYDKSVKQPYRMKSVNANPQTGPAANTSRPLTRGALGKDFPSAKKRSWIDVEKELETELDF